MFILHVALQGCLRSENVEYGLTADTGGHIRYLLDLATASSNDPSVERIVIATRRFESPLGADYAMPFEPGSGKIEIVRLQSDSPGYIEKEAMHGEAASFAEALVAYIQSQDVQPDIIHAHYADAAAVAVIVEDRLGIPFLFTAHSLGRVKQKAFQGVADIPGISERLASEEIAMERAAIVIASSRDEAEVQWSSYTSYEAGRIRILPPGIDLSRFDSVASSDEVEASIDRFLREPGKPVLLALARPVYKKNLAALVTAYGQNQALQDMANLVIFAGTREIYQDLDGDMADTMRELIDLIDRYDLYGKVAYPKTHRAEDVPAIYAYARDRRGIFVNPALNEPFGLTLLEASAVGLPLIATDSGGPNDIIEMAGNGILVDPRSPDAIGAAAVRILSSEALWDEYAAAGARVAENYDWPRHVETYHDLIRGLCQPRAPREAPARILISDIDNTLVGCAEGIRIFRNWRQNQRGLGFGVATGRSFHSAMAILEQQHAPRPQIMITSVGSEIYHLDDNGITFTQDREWLAHISTNWDRDRLAALMAEVPSIAPQAPLEQRPHKLSYFSDGNPETVRDIRLLLAKAGLACSIIHSHGRYLDILPAAASKGTAVDYVRRHYHLAIGDVFVAGDSGNDIEMLQTVPQAIIVANFSDGLASLPQLAHSFVATKSHARGIIEGMSYFLENAGEPCNPAS